MLCLPPVRDQLLKFLKLIGESTHEILVIEGGLRTEVFGNDEEVEIETLSIDLSLWFLLF